MTVRDFRPILLASTLALAACGGDGSHVAPLPPPAPPQPLPVQTFALVPAATTSQQFAVAGAARDTPTDPTPHLGAADQLQVRYVASSNSYEVQLPNSQSWIALTVKSDGAASGGGVSLVTQLGGQYSAVFNWFSGGSLGGVEAVGIPTAAGSVPVTGTATFNAIAVGTTPERTNDNQLISPVVQGWMTFNFDFAQGSLSGSFHPFLDPEWHDYDLGTYTFRDTVYSTGSTTFSGAFDTSLAGMNSFSGLFTGPAAQALIGNFALPYKSLIDGQTYQSGGAFVGNK